MDTDQVVMAGNITIFRGYRVESTRKLKGWVLCRKLFFATKLNPLVGLNGFQI